MYEAANTTTATAALQATRAGDYQFHLCDSAERVHVEHVLLKVAVAEGFVESAHVFARLLDFFFHEFGHDSCWCGRAGCCSGRCCGGITVKCSGARCCGGITVKYCRGRCCRGRCCGGRCSGARCCGGITVKYCRGRC